MASEKTEQPTAKRLRESREKGDVPKSMEVISAAVVFAIIGYLIVASIDIFHELYDCLSFTLVQATTRPYDESLRLIGARVIEAGLHIVIPIVSITMSAALIAILVQIGFLVAPKAAIPKLSNLNPQKWFKQVFAKKNAVEFLKNILKVTILGYVAWQVILSNMREILQTYNHDISSVWTIMGALLKDLGIYTIIAFGTIALLDFVYTRFKYTKDHMMTIDEVKREYKESEGDPYIKQKRKQMHREMLSQNTVSNVRKANVLIVNPTHYAVALSYKKGITPLPLVVAKGQGELALRMIAEAKAANIPIMREPPLARALYAQTQENCYIPADLLAPVAKVLSVLQRLQE